jgi:hypothetical protein
MRIAPAKPLKKVSAGFIGQRLANGKVEEWENKKRRRHGASGADLFFCLRQCQRDQPARGQFRDHHAVGLPIKNHAGRGCEATRQYDRTRACCGEELEPPGTRRGKVQIEFEREKSRPRPRSSPG